MFVGLCFLLTSLVTVCFGVTAVETHDRRGGVLSVCFFFVCMVKSRKCRIHTQMSLIWLQEVQKQVWRCEKNWLHFFNWSAFCCVLVFFVHFVFVLGFLCFFFTFKLSGERSENIVQVWFVAWNAFHIYFFSCHLQISGLQRKQC